MTRDAEDRALFKRGRHGALVSRILATGSSLTGGSVQHRSGRRRLNEAIAEGKPILCRASDGVAMRVATFDEVLRAHKASDGKILVMEVLAEDGISWGCACVVRKEQLSQVPLFDPKPRLVKKGVKVK